MDQRRKNQRVLAAPSLAGETTYRSNMSTRGPQIDYRNFNFQELDEDDEVTFDRYCGPTPESNWFIPGKILAGAYPASVDDQETFELLTSIMLLGITKFVCLQQEYRTRGVTEHMWRNGQALRPYFEDVRTIAREKEAFPMIPGIKDLHSENTYKFVHFPIRDCSVTDDDRVQALCIDLVRAVSLGEVLYVHCWGGHGRTGTVLSIMLHLMYGLNADDCMARCQLAHDLRQCPVVVGSPQTQTQRDQVVRVIGRLQAQAQKEALKESHRNLQAQQQQPVSQKSVSGLGPGLSRATTARGSLRDVGAMTPGRQPQLKMTRLNSKNNNGPTTKSLMHPPPTKQPLKKAAVSPQALHGLYTVTQSGVATNVSPPSSKQTSPVSSPMAEGSINHASLIPLPVRRHTYGEDASAPPESDNSAALDMLAPLPIVRSNSTSKLGNGAVNRTVSTLKPVQDDTDKPAIVIESIPTDIETAYSEDFDEIIPEDMSVDGIGAVRMEPKPPSQPISSSAVARRRRSNHSPDETRAAAATV